jgi:hypothetical protein
VIDLQVDISKADAANLEFTLLASRSKQFQTNRLYQAIELHALYFQRSGIEKLRESWKFFLAFAEELGEVLRFVGPLKGMHSVSWVLNYLAAQHGRIVPPTTKVTGGEPTLQLAGTSALMWMLGHFAHSQALYANRPLAAAPGQASDPRDDSYQIQFQERIVFLDAIEAKIERPGKVVRTFVAPIRIAPTK